MLIEELDQLGEVGQRSGQPVDLVDDDDVDLAGPNVLQEVAARLVGPYCPRRSLRRHIVP